MGNNIFFSTKSIDYHSQDSGRFHVQTHSHESSRWALGSRIAEADSCNGSCSHSCHSFPCNLWILFTVNQLLQFLISKVKACLFYCKQNLGLCRTFHCSQSSIYPSKTSEKTSPPQLLCNANIANNGQLPSHYLTFCLSLCAFDIMVSCYCTLREI